MANTPSEKLTYHHWEKPMEKLEEYSKLHRIQILHLHFDEEEFIIFNEKVLPELGSDNGFYLNHESPGDGSSEHKIHIMGFVGSEAQFPYFVGISVERHIFSKRKKSYRNR